MSHTDVTKRDEGTGEWRKLHDVELNDLYSSSNIVQVIKAIIWMGGECTMNGERREVYWVLVGKPEEKRPHGRHRRKWEDNIRMDLQEMECGIWTG